MPLSTALVCLRSSYASNVAATLLSDCGTADIWLSRQSHGDVAETRVAMLLSQAVSHTVGSEDHNYESMIGAISDDYTTVHELIDDPVSLSLLVNDCNIRHEWSASRYCAPLRFGDAAVVEATDVATVGSTYDFDWHTSEQWSLSTISCAVCGLTLNDRAGHTAVQPCARGHWGHRRCWGSSFRECTECAVIGVMQDNITDESLDV